MCRQQNGPSTFSKSRHDLPQLQAALRVEPGRRLVEKQNLRIADERAGHRQPLLLPTGELADARVPLLIESEIAQQILGRRTFAVERSEQPQRFQDRQLFSELGFLQRDTDPLADFLLVLFPVESKDLDGAAVGNGETFQNLDRRRLAGAVGTEET